MALENLVGSNKFISDLIASNPVDTDARETWDNHLRGIKNCTINTFPNFSNTLSPATELTHLQWNNLLSSEFDDTTRWTKEELEAWMIKCIGTIQMFINNPQVLQRPPLGWLECDGRQIYSDQFPVLHNIYGDFIPDLRGYFIRGYDPTARFDPDGLTRPVFSEQLHKTGDHEHDQTLNNVGSGGDLQELEHGTTTTPDGDEMRPINAAVYFAVKTDDQPGVPRL